MTQDWAGHTAEFTIKTRVALLVDGENVSQNQANLILETAARCGSVSVRRVYGDMTALRDWEADHRFTSIHTGHGRSKNTADINLVIDAMDFAHSGKATAFVIVSSDGDFAPLATRLREAGFPVTGLGKQTASLSFRETCTDFHVILKVEPQAPKGPAVSSATAKSMGAEVANSVRAQAAIVVNVKSALSRIDAAIHRICRNHGGPSCKITLGELGKLMPIEEGIQRKETGKSTWLAYLTASSGLYVLEGKAGATQVRLCTP